MRFALVDSGLGVLPAAMHLRRLCPAAALVLSMDPDGMPWGQRKPDDIAERALGCARATLPYDPDVLVLACNTASVRALDVLRREFEPGLPVVGTVPAIKPAAAGGGAVAIWATAATTGSPYQRDLIRQFAQGVRVTEVACPGLADAIEAADQEAIDAAIGAAAFLTPPAARAVVLGCTQYELATDRIRSVLPRIRLHGSAAAVATQTLRRRAAWSPGPAEIARTARGSHRLGGRPALAAPAAQVTTAPATAGPVPARAARGTGDGRRHAVTGPPEVSVLLSGEPGELPEAALNYAEGRLLAGLRLPSPTA